MDVRFTPEQETWRAEVQAFLCQEITPEFREVFEQQDAAVSFGSRAFSRKLAERGWLPLHWPREYGGQERSFIDQAILAAESGTGTQHRSLAAEPATPHVRAREGRSACAPTRTATASGWMDASCSCRSRTSPIR